MKKSFLHAALAIGFLLLFPAQTRAGEQSDQRLFAVQSLDQRVATIGHRLAVEGADLCVMRQWLSGFAVHDLSQYGAESRDAAAAQFGLDAGPAVLAVAADGPAERAGLEVNDILLAADGRVFPDGFERKSASFDVAERILDLLEQEFSDGTAELRVKRNGETLTIRIEAEEGCESRFQLIPSTNLNARADGQYVQVTSAIATYVKDDAELAAVLAHEFAHNVLQHRRRLNEAEVARGFLSNFGRNARLIRETEAEADRLSIHLLDRAGYDPEAAVRFWTRFGPRGIGLFNSPTHPHWRKRVAAFREEIASIARQKAVGAKPVPAFLAKGAAGQTR